MHVIIGHSDVHPNSLKNGFLKLWLLDHYMHFTAELGCQQWRLFCSIFMPIDPRKKLFDRESSSEVCQMTGYSNQRYENFDFICRRLTSGNVMGRHRHPVLFWTQVGCFNFSENCLRLYLLTPVQHFLVHPGGFPLLISLFSLVPKRWEM